MAKRSNGRKSVLRVYDSYVFRDKDPVIDVLRTAKDDAKLRLADIAENSGVASTTLYNWFSGKTQRPQFATVAAATRSMGPEAINAVAELLRRGK